MSTLYWQNTNTASASWTNTANWSTLAAPAASDAVTLASVSPSIDSGLLNTATIASLNVPMTFTGTAGTATQTVKSVSGIVRTSSTATATCTAHGYSNGDVVIISGASQSDYNGSFTVSNVTTNTFDYTVANTPTTPATGTILVRKRSHLIQPCTSATFGAPSNNSSVTGSGPSRWKQDFGTAQATITILNTSSSSTDTGLEPLRILGSHASNVLYMIGGTAGIATSTPDETSTFATVNQTGGTLNMGSGVTWTTVYQSGGTLRLNSGAAAGTLTQADGSFSITGTGTVGTMTIGGTGVLNMRASSGTTVTTLTLNDGATLDLTSNPAALSVTTLVVNGSARVLTNAANPGHFTWTTLTRNPGAELTLE